MSEIKASKSSVFNITPFIAKLWLSRCQRLNRTVRKHHVTFLANEIIAGRFLPSTILKSGDDIIDGQHRLLACIEADMPIRIWLCEVPDGIDVTKLDPLRQTTSDILTRRTGQRTNQHTARIASSLAAMHGGSSEQHLERARKIAAAFPERRLPGGVVLHTCLDPDNPRHVEFMNHIYNQTAQQASVLRGWLSRPDVIKDRTREGMLGRARAITRALMSFERNENITERTLSVAANINLGRKQQ